MNVKLLVLVLSTGLINTANEAPYARAMKAIADAKPDKVFEPYAELTNKQEQQEVLAAFVQHWKSTYNLLPFEKGQAIQAIWAFVNKYPRSDFEANLTDTWKKDLARNYPPFAERYSTYVAPRTPTPPPVPSPSSSSSSSSSSGSSSTIKLVNKEGKEFTIARDVALDNRASRLLSSMLTLDPNATSLKLSLINKDGLQIIVPLLTRVHALIGQSVIDLAITNDLIAGLKKNEAIRKLVHQEALRMVVASHYLQAPYLVTAFLWELAAAVQGSSEKQQGEQFELIKKYLPQNVLPELAKLYFLQFDRDIDQQLGLPHQSIDLKTLIAYGKLPDWWEQKMPMSELLLSFKIPDADKTRMLGAFLKLPGNNVNGRGAARRSGIYYATAPQTRILIAAGADVNHLDQKGVTPLIHELKKTPLDTEKIQILLTNGAAPEVSTYDGRDALAYLMQSKADNAIEIAPLLISKITNVEQLKKDLAQAKQLFQEWETEKSPHQTHFITLLQTIIQSLSNRLASQTITPEVQAAFAEFGLPTTATAEEVKKTFRKLALARHPDRGGTQEEFKRLGAANAVLKKYLGIQ